MDDVYAELSIDQHVDVLRRTEKGNVKFCSLLKSQMSCSERSGDDGEMYVLTI